MPGSHGIVDNCSFDRPLLERRCRWCTGLFYVCASCFRGQAYCCDGCNVAGYADRRRAANRRHRRSPEGRAEAKQKQVRVLDNTPRPTPPLRALLVAALCGLSLSETEFLDDEAENPPTCVVCDRASTVVVPLCWVDDRAFRRSSFVGPAPGGTR